MLGTVAVFACSDWGEQRKKLVVLRFGQRSWPSAHERFFTAAVKQPQRPSISWLCSRTVKQTQRSHISSLSVIVCGMDFVESVAVCALLLRTRAKRKKEVLGASTCKSKTTERAVPQIVWRLAYPSKKNLWIFKNDLQQFRRAFIHDWTQNYLPKYCDEDICATRRKTGRNSKVRTLN
jgi:hypothetical protein